VRTAERPCWTVDAAGSRFTHRDGCSGLQSGRRTTPVVATAANSAKTPNKNAVSGNRHVCHAVPSHRYEVVFVASHVGPAMASTRPAAGHACNLRLLPGAARPLAHSAADCPSQNPSSGTCLVAFQSGQSGPLVTAHEKKFDVNQQDPEVAHGTGQHDRAAKLVVEGGEGL
jgi:hypothetical protein